MDEIIKFNKSFTTRFKEYCEVFGDGVIPVSCIKNKWIYYLSLTLDVFPWQAVWKIPRLTCESLGINFPSVVLTLVMNVNSKEMRATVKILAVQDDISIPEIHIVPITQLWATKTQDEKVAHNIEGIADALDRIRFFYLYLFMPWDYNNDDTTDWKANHLESRLKFYYELKHGKFPRAVGEHIHSLLREARRLQNRKEHFELEMLRNEEETDIVAELEEKLLEIYIRLLEIQTEINILEIPKLREIKLKRTLDTAIDFGNKNGNIWVICNSGNADNYINFLQALKTYYPTEMLSFSSSLDKVLQTSDSSKDVFLLNESHHNIHTTGTLETGGLLKGIGMKEKIVLTSNNENTILDIVDGTVFIENITIHALLLQCAILIKRGKIILKSCDIIGDKSSIRQGIIVLSGAELILENCQISGFSTAVVVESGAKATIKNCNMRSVNVGLHIYDKATVNSSRVYFQHCKEHAIILETDSGNKVGNFDLLNLIPDITLESVTVENNFNGNVAIVHKKHEAC